MSDRGERLLQRGRPAEACAAFTAAAKKDPSNPSLWLRVADAAFLAGRAANAARAAARAHALGGGDDTLRRALQAHLLAGDEASARRALKGRAGAEAAFWLAVLACRAARWAEARRLFLEAAAADPERLAERAGLFAAWAGHRAAGVARRSEARGISIVGLGWKRPRQATVGGLDALAGCRKLVAVANTLDDATRDLLCLFRAEVSAVAFRGSEAEAAAAARRALRAAAAGPAGTVTRGNPLVYGRFAARLVALARAKGLPVRVLPGVSSYEELAGVDRPGPEAPLGLELRNSHDAGTPGARAMAVFTPYSRSKGALPHRPALWFSSEGLARAPITRVSAAEAASMLARGGAPGILYYASSAKMPVPRLSFKADARLELIGAIELVSGARAARFVDPKDEYAAAARKLLKPFSGHPAVRLQAAFPAAFDFVERCELAHRLTPALEADAARFLPESSVTRAGGRAAVDAWFEALRDLSRASDFAAFFRSRRAALDKRAGKFREAAAAAKVLEDLEAYAGRPFDGTYEVRVSPYFDAERMLNAVWPSGGATRALVTVIGADAGGRDPEYYLRERLPGALWHQLAHGYFDASVEAARPALAGRHDGRATPSFGSWEQCVKEYVVIAVTARLLARSAGEAAQERFLNNGDADLFPAMPALIERLREFEGDRARWPRLAAFLPRLFEAFPAKA